MTTPKSGLRVVFMGTPEFAVASLEAIHHSVHQIITVVTVPDKPAGRGQKLRKSDVKVYAEALGLPLLQPEKLTDTVFVEQISEAAPDVIVVVAFRMLPKVVWEIPHLGTINLHASLLPQYRGAAPINRAIMNGETQTGLTTFLIDHQIDTGQILMQLPLNIEPDETAGELHDKMKTEGADLLLKTLDQLANGKIQLTPQEQLTKNIPLKKAPKIFKEETRINWFAPAADVYNHIRGLSPYPAAHFTITHPKKGERNIRVFKCQWSGHVPLENKVPKITTDGHSYMNIELIDGLIQLTEVQLQGRKRMKIEEFLRGFPLNDSWNLSE
jgi:methionyl-tRNA formyltransferase